MPPKSLPQSDSGLVDSWGRRNRKLADRKCDSCSRQYRPARDGSRYCSRECLWSKNGGRNRKAESWWVNGRGYIEMRLNGDRRIKQHRLVMERLLGRPILPSEDVHHVNGIKTDNRPENLRVMGHGEHTRETNRERWSRAAIEKATS